MITAEPNSLLGYICAEIDRMEPNEKRVVPRHTLQEIGLNPYMQLNRFTPADRILENIVGSAYTHKYYIDLGTGDAVFTRMEKTGERYYTSPDRR